MTSYWDDRFLKHLNKDKIKCVFEVGARYGDESIKLSEVFSNANIYSFECNPLTVNMCREKLKNHNRIKFFNFGLGETETVLPFYSYILNNDGASSFLKRIDFVNSQVLTGFIEIKSLANVMHDQNLQQIDLLCMDVQGYELNILKGCNKYLENIKYIIMEEPKKIINTLYLPENVHSNYINCPTPDEIKEFMNKNNFIEIERIDENAIEDNVMYINTKL